MNALSEYEFRNSVSIFVRVKQENLGKALKNSLDKMGESKLLDNICFIFGQRKSIVDKWKLQVMTRILCSLWILVQKFCLVFVREQRDNLWNMPENWIGWWTHRHLLLPWAYVKMLKTVKYDTFVEQTVLYKMWCRTPI